MQQRQRTFSSTRTWVGFFIGLGLVGILSIPASGAIGQPSSSPHPRLFATDKRIDAVQAAIQNEGSHHQQAYTAMRARVEASSPNNLDAYGGGNYGYRRTWLAREAALLSLIASKPEAKSRYADKAFAALQAVFKGDHQDRYPHRGYGLSRAMMSMGLGIAYDWCYPAWSLKQRRWVKKKIEQALDAWPEYEHANLKDDRISNWVAVCRGGELVLMLAAREETERGTRYERLKQDLIRHMDNGFGSLGVSQEGAGYTEYPGTFLLPAIYATQQIGDNDLSVIASLRPWWKLAMYTHSFQPHSRKFLQTGVAHSTNFDEGWASLLLNQVPDPQLPQFVYWYDRHMGIKAPGEPREKFDADRAGTTWALLYYPKKVEAQDPTGIYPIGIGDNRGYYFFRNQWKNENDILASVMADTVHHGHAWDQPEALAINLMAFNTRFFGGPGKKRSDKFYSSLLVDGEYNFEHGSRYTGKKSHFEVNRQSGYAIVKGGGLYKQLGVSEATRHFHVDFSLESGQALITTMDRIRASTAHTYTWQANLGSEQGSDGISITQDREAGRPTFLLKGRNNGFVKGWVIHPRESSITDSEDPLQIKTEGQNEEIWLVLFVGQGVPPKAKVSGKGLESKVEITGKTVQWQKGRLEID